MLLPLAADSVRPAEPKGWTTPCRKLWLQAAADLAAAQAEITQLQGRETQLTEEAAALRQAAEQSEQQVGRASPAGCEGSASACGSSWRCYKRKQSGRLPAACPFGWRNHPLP